MTDDDSMPSPSPRRDRSPSFPYIELDWAIDLARKLLNAAKQSEVRLADIAKSWDTTPTSGSLMRYTAALQAYGLVESSGAGTGRKVKITDDAKRILNDSRPGVKERLCAEAALKPRLILEMYENWGHDRPADEIAKSSLQFDYNFTPDAARRFLVVYDAALKYVNEVEYAPLISNETDNSTIIMPDKPIATQRIEHEQEYEKAITNNSRRDIFTIDEGEVSVTMPTTLSRASFEDFSDWLDLLKRKAQRTIVD